MSFFFVINGDYVSLSSLYDLWIADDVFMLLLFSLFTPPDDEDGYVTASSLLLL